MPDINVRFRVLDSFRGLCAIFVVLYHLKVIGAFSEWSFFRNSGIFVEFFFILSGFVLTHGYAFKSNLSFKNFISSRVFRLFPLHVLVLFAFIILELSKWLVSSQINVTLNNAAFTGDYSPKFILPNLLLIHAWFESLNPLSFNTLSWSISIEFYMYIFLFITLFIAAKYRWLLWLSITLFGFVSILVESAILTSQSLRGLSCFFAGTLGYLIYRSRLFQSLKFSLQVATLIEVVLLFFTWYLVQSNVPNKSVLASLLFLIVILFFSLEVGYLSKILTYAFFQWLGKLSYSIYMTHGLVIYILTALFLILPKFLNGLFSSTLNGERYFNLGNDLHNNLLVLMVIITVLFLSALTYKYIEIPGQQLGRAFILTDGSKGKSYEKVQQG